MNNADIEKYVWMTLVLNDYLNQRPMTDNKGLQDFIELGSLEEIKAFYENKMPLLKFEITRDVRKKVKESRNTFLPSSHFYEIKNDKEAILFTIYVFLKKFDMGHSEYKFHDCYLYLIYIIQNELILKREITKKEIIDTIEQSLVDFKKINLKKDLKPYINKKNFTEWAYDYLDKKILSDPMFSFFFKHIPFSIRIHSLESRKLYLLTFYNILKINKKISKYEYNTELYDLKKAWHQKIKRARDKKNKSSKSVNYSLTKNAKDALSKLSTSKNLSEIKTLESLINEAYEKDTKEQVTPNLSNTSISTNDSNA